MRGLVHYKGAKKQKEGARYCKDCTDSCPLQWHTTSDLIPLKRFHFKSFHTSPWCQRLETKSSMEGPWRIFKIQSMTKGGKHVTHLKKENKF